MKIVMSCETALYCWSGDELKWLLVLFGGWISAQANCEDYAKDLKK
jgi:hypothetical protein